VVLSGTSLQGRCRLRWRVWQRRISAVILCFVDSCKAVIYDMSPIRAKSNPCCTRLLVQRTDSRLICHCVNINGHWCAPFHAAASQSQVAVIGVCNATVFLGYDFVARSYPTADLVILKGIAEEEAVCWPICPTPVALGDNVLVLRLKKSGSRVCEQVSETQIVDSLELPDYRYRTGANLTEYTIPRVLMYVLPIHTLPGDSGAPVAINRSGALLLVGLVHGNDDGRAVCISTLSLPSVLTSS
jgi:hypothetical protein